MAINPIFLKKLSYYYFYSWGKFVGIHFMNIRGVAIYDYELLKEIYGKVEATGRPHNFIYQQRMGGGNHGELPSHILYGGLSSTTLHAQ